MPNRPSPALILCLLAAVYVAGVSLAMVHTASAASRCGYPSKGGIGHLPKVDDKEFDPAILQKQLSAVADQISKDPEFKEQLTCLQGESGAPQKF